MHHVKALATVVLTGGTIKLTPLQAEKRDAALQSLDVPDTYDIVQDIQLKTGEMFQLKEIPKHLAEMLESVKAPRGKNKQSSNAD